MTTKTADCPKMIALNLALMPDCRIRDIHAERALGVPGGQPQDFQRDTRIAQPQHPCQRLVLASPVSIGQYPALGQPRRSSCLLPLGWRQNLNSRDRISTGAEQGRFSFSNTAGIRCLPACGAAGCQGQLRRWSGRAWRVRARWDRGCDSGGTFRRRRGRRSGWRW
jgi:hypothetical protein